MPLDTPASRWIECRPTGRANIPHFSHPKQPPEKPLKSSERTAKEALKTTRGLEKESCVTRAFSSKIALLSEGPSKLVTFNLKLIVKY